MTYMKSAALAAFLATVYSLVNGNDAVNTRYLRSSRAGPSTTAQFVPKIAPTGKNKAGKKRISKRVPSERNLEALAGGDVVAGGSLRLIQRCTKERTITLHGVDHQEPLTADQAVFLEEALKKALNDAHENEGVNARTALLITEELDEEYYATTTASNSNGGDRRFLRGARGLELINDGSIDVKTFFDMHFLLDIICYVWEDDDDAEPRVKNTLFPMRDPVQGATCPVCDPDSDDDDNHDALRVEDDPPSAGETASPTSWLRTMAPNNSSDPPTTYASNVDLGGRSGGGGGAGSIAESNLCATIRTGPFSRFESTTRCSIK
jgi:hypothetical protein